MNIKQQMNYHAREYRRLKAMAMDMRTTVRRIAIVVDAVNSARIESMANRLMEEIDNLFDFGSDNDIKMKWPALKAKVQTFLRQYGAAVREDRGLMETMDGLQHFLRTNSGKKPGKRMM